MVDVRGGAGIGGIRAEIARMQDGVRAWVPRAVRSARPGLRDTSASALLSMLCAAAFSPLIAVGIGITGTAGIASIGVLSSVGSGVLSSVLASACDRLRSRGGQHEPSQVELEDEIARQIEHVLARQDIEARALRNEIAAVLEQIDAGGIMLRAAIDTGNDNVRRDVVTAIDSLGNDFAEMGFLIKSVAEAAAGIQEGLDKQGANVLTIIEQNAQQSAQIRLVREDLADMVRRDRNVFAQPVGENRVSRWVNRCPYRGLSPFGETDSEVFYGRERMTASLAARVARQVTRGGLVIVTGASGAGKSSLLMAGLLPALARGLQVQGSARWPHIVITPTADPLTKLATPLAALAGLHVIDVRDELAQHPHQAHLFAWQAVLADAARSGRHLSQSTESSRLILIVDQFEQVFTLNAEEGTEAERRAFIGALCAIATQPTGPSGAPSALVVIAVRGDFWDRCAAYPQLAYALEEGQFVVGPMTESDLRLAITGPADAAGLQIEPSLIDTILGDLRTAASGNRVGVLPLLSQAMLLTWENREGDLLTSHGYGQAGGIRNAVQTSADAVYGDLSAKQQSLARYLLRQMTVASSDGRLTRRPVRRAELYDARPDTPPALVDAVLEALSAKRLIVLDHGNVQIAHDALLYAWPRLRGWLEEDQASWVLYGQLADDAAAWHRNGADPSFLYRGTQLAAIQQTTSEWSANPVRYPALAETERAFLHASQRAATRSGRQRRMLAISLVLLLVASLTGAAFAVAAARNADQQRRVADRQRQVAVSGELAAQSEGFARVDPVMQSLLAAASWQIAPTAQARDAMLEAFAQPERAILRGGRDGWLRVAFNPAGKILATAGAAGKVQLWDVATHRQLGPPLQAPNTRGGVFGLTFNSSGKLLATAAADGKVQLWDVATHKQLGPPLSATSGRTGIYMLALSADGKTVTTVDGDGKVQLWDVATHKQLGPSLQAPRFRFNPFLLALSPNGTTAAIKEPDGTVQLWDVATHRQLGLPLQAHGAKGSVSCLAFSRNGNILATGYPDGTVRLWDVTTQRQLGPPLHAPRAGGRISTLAFSPDGKTLAEFGGRETVWLWDIATRNHTDPINSVNIGPSGVSIALGTGKLLAVEAGPNGAVQLLDMTIWGQLGPPIHAATPQGIGALAFSPDGKTLATAHGDDRIRFWNVTTRRQIGPTIKSGKLLAKMGGLAFSPDGKLLATADADFKVRLWDVATHRQIGPPIKPTRKLGATQVTFSPDGKLLATVGMDGIVRLWDIATHRQIHPAFGRASRAGAFAAVFSPDGKLLATAAGTGGKMWLWNVATHRQIGSAMDGSSTGPVIELAFSPDGKLLASVGQDGTARLWNPATHRQIGPPIDATNASRIMEVAFSPEGQFLAIAHEDGTVKLLDVTTRRQIGPVLNANISPGWKEMTFSPNGNLLVTVGNYNMIRLWNVAFPANLVNAMCSIAGRSLTLKEWKNFLPSEPYHNICP
jgi:WD40 repeat protein